MKTDDPDALALSHLTAVDPSLRLVHRRLGDPPAWRRRPGFATLVHIVLEQQVSLDSAAATFGKLSRHLNGVTPGKLILLTPQRMRQLGVSRQKARYLFALADDVIERRFDPRSLGRLDDQSAAAAIRGRLGLGQWSADVYLMMALRRPDLLPTGDLGLVKGLEELDGGSYADADKIVARAESWRPYRSMATKLIWTLYLDNRNRLESFR